MAKKQKYKFKPKLKKIHNNIYIVYFGKGNQYYMNASLFRMQEYYESSLDDIFHKKFTLEQFMDAYVADSKNGIFDYFEIVLACNVPGHFVCEFFDMFANELTSKEKDVKALLEGDGLIQRYNETGEKFYLIGVEVPNNKKTHLNHEIAHALYGINSSYKEEMDELTSNYKFKMQMTRSLCKLRYADKPFIIYDEIQAIMATEPNKFLVGEMDIKRKYIDAKAQAKFRKVFKKYVKLEKIKV